MPQNLQSFEASFEADIFAHYAHKITDTIKFKEKQHANLLSLMACVLNPPRAWLDDLNNLFLADGRGNFLARAGCASTEDVIPWERVSYRSERAAL